MNNIEKILTKSNALKEKFNDIENKSKHDTLTVQEFLSFAEEIKNFSNDMIREIDCIIGKHHEK